MKNKITIKNGSKDHKLEADDYFLLGSNGDKIDMITNLKPEDLLIFLMPFLVELEKIVNKDSLN